MRKMSGILGLTLLVLLLSLATSEALWPEKKPATAGEAARGYAKGANQATTDAAGNAGEDLLPSAIIHEPKFLKQCIYG